jgi:probable HAF family extracellular repeat protein
LAAPSGLNASAGSAIGDLGAVLGERSSSAFPIKATSSSYSFQDLGTLPGGTWSNAVAINDVGQIIGGADNATGVSRSVLWKEGVIRDLGPWWAKDINNAGQVVGSDGPRAVLWQDGVLRDLGTLPGSSQCDATGINDRGQVIGTCLIQGAPTVFRWQDGVMTDLGTPPGTWSGAYGSGLSASAINDVGQILVWGNRALRVGPYAYLWADGTWRPILPPGDNVATVHDINNAGQVAGESGGYRLAFRWENGVATNLGPLGNSGLSEANGINDEGQVVGRIVVGCCGTSDAFLWDNGVMSDLGGLPNFFNEARGINDAGQVVGDGLFSGQIYHALLWSPRPAASTTDAIIDLGTLPGDVSSRAAAINNLDQVVGVSWNAAGASRGFLWENGQMRDLGNLGAPSGYNNPTLANDVNDRGQVVGSSNNVSGYQRAFLWKDGVITDLGSPPSPYPVSCAANSISNRGQVVGYCVLQSDVGGRPHALLWQNGSIVDLGTPDPQRPFNRAIAINDAGRVIVENTDGSTSAPIHYIWQNGTWTRIGIPPNRSTFFGSDINDAGQVAGISGYRMETHFAYRWDAGVFTSLGSLGPACCTESEALGINGPGRIVGLSDGRPFFWEDGTMTDLGGLGYGGGAAYDVNDAGHAVGQSQASPDPSVRHAVLWSAPAVHDVGVASASANPASADVGTPISISATLQNFGTQRETFDVQASTGSTVIGVQTVTSLPAKASADVSFSWDTSSAAPGSYPIEVRVRGVAGDANSSNDASSAGTITLYSAIGVAASATPGATDVGLSVRFACTAGGGAPPHTFHWDFGDGSGDPSAAPAHTYSKSGTMSAVCTATDIRGRSASASTIVHVDPAPAVSATVNSSATTPGRAVSFTATGAGGSGTYTYNWGFGDGTSAQGATVLHAFDSAGQYTVVVTTYDARGASASNTVMVAVASESTTKATTSDPITFTAAGSDGGGSHLTITWYFGDGKSDAGGTVTHTYAKPGSYTPKVAVTDSGGRTSEVYLDTITIRAAPSPEPSPSPNPSPTPEPSPSASSTPFPIEVAGGIIAGAAGMAVAIYLARRRPRNPKP